MHDCCLIFLVGVALHLPSQGGYTKKLSPTTSETNWKENTPRKQIEQGKRDLQKYKDLPTLADSFVEDVEALEKDIAPLATKMTANERLVCCYFFSVWVKYYDA